MSIWTQLWVRALDTTLNNPISMRRVDAGIQSAGAVFCAPAGTPVQEPDGTFEVRVFAEDSGYVEYLLTTHYRCEIARKLRHSNG